MLLLASDLIIVAFSLGYFIGLVVFAHIVAYRENESGGMLVMIMTILCTAMLISVVIRDNSNYETMANKVIQLYSQSPSNNITYSDCLMESEMDRLVGYIWRTHSLLANITQVKTDDNQCILLLNK